MFHQIVPLTPSIPVVFQSGMVQKEIQAVEEEVILTRLLDLDGLNFILIAMVSPTRSSKIHLPSGTDLVVSVRSSMEALTGTF